MEWKYIRGHGNKKPLIQDIILRDGGTFKKMFDSPQVK